MQDRCANCDYDLAGLGIVGRCPECGQPFDRQSGRGLTTDISKAMKRGDAIVFWVGIGFMLLLALLLITLGWVGSLYSSNPMAPLSVGLTLGGGLLLVALLLILVRSVGRET
jgi:hypothetical protein